MMPDGSYRRLPVVPGEAPLNAQLALLKMRISGR